MLNVVDSHAHLCDAAFREDVDDVLARARLAGVSGVVAVGEDLADARRNLELAAEYPGVVHPAAGLFPTDLDIERAEELSGFIRAHADRWIGIGEVGLDHWKVKDDAGRRLQREIFGAFIDLAIELDLPLNVHSRSAGAKTIELLLQRGATRVQMHAFDGRAARALAGVEAGYFFSIPPSIVRSAQKQKLVKRISLENLLVETDSPVLGSDPSERNEPSAAIESVRAIAEIKEVSPEEVAHRVRENTARLYGAEMLP